MLPGPCTFNVIRPIMIDVLDLPEKHVAYCMPGVYLQRLVLH